MTTSSEAARTGERYESLLRLARDVTGLLDLDAVLGETFRALSQIIDFDGGSIILLDGTDELRIVAGVPDPTPEALATRIPVGQGVAGGIVATGEPRYIADIVGHEDVSEAARKRSISTGVRAYFGVPLISRGRVIGLLQVDSRTPDAWTDEDRLIVLAFTPIVAAAVQNAQLFEREAAAVSRFQELDRLQRDFVTLVSHELRTPLTSVLGFSDTILRYLEELPTEDIRSMVQATNRAASRLSALVEELLDLSLIQSGRVVLRPQWTDVAQLLGDVAAQFVPVGHHCEIEVTGDVSRVFVDPQRLHQVLGNLVANAVRFSDVSSVVRIKAERLEKTLRLSVIDTGPGIAEEQRSRIFEQFVQLQDLSTRTAPGFGIGLYVVAQLCRQMGAEIGVESTLGVGSTFTVTLPLAMAGAATGLAGSP